MSNKKKKKANVIAKRTLTLSLAASLLGTNAFTSIPLRANPVEDLGIEISQEIINEALRAPAAYPTNIVDKINWDNKGVTDADKDYWSLNQQLGIEPTQKIVRVSTSDAIEIVDINYQGYFVDAEGRTNLRLVYNEKSAAASLVWKKALLKFDQDLYDLIDFDKSFGIAENGKTYALNASNGANERSLDVASMISARTQNRNNIPINLVLKDGKTYQDLGNKNYKIQMRLVDNKSVRIYAFAPKKSSIDYSTYTKQTVIPVADNIDGLFLRGPREDDGKKFAMQRSFMSEFIANPENFPDTSNLGILRTEYQAERDSTNPKDVKDGKPAGFVQAFDAKLVDYFKEDAAGNIAYTNMLNADRTEVKGVQKFGIKKEHINYSADKKIAYIVFGQSNFKKDGVHVVSLDTLDKIINQGGFYFTAVDYVVDKTKLQNTFETTGTTKVDFNIMTGWAETNPTGWTIFEKDYDDDFVVDEGESFMIDTTQDPARKQIMIQVGDPEEALIRTMQGYYAGHKDLSTSFEKIENIGVGLYEFTLREGAKIKNGEKFRVLIPDAADHQGPVNFLETHNGSKYNEGAAKLKLQKDRNINMHLYRKDKGSFKLIYTLKGETEQKELVFKKGGLWQYSDKDKVMTGIPNKGVDPSGGNFWINTKKLEPGKDIIVEAYNAAGEKEENLTSWFKYKPLEKSAEKYERMAWVDHAETLASVGIDKSTYVPYQEIFTNDYKAGTDEIYKDSRALPEGKENFMNKANKIEGFTQYDGVKIRMRYIESDTKTLVGKAEAAANEYNDKGEVVGKDLSQKVTINGKEYDAMPYELDLSTVSELRDADPETGLELKKDMRLIFNASNGSSLPSDWYDTRVKTRVLFDATDGQFADASKKVVKIAPDNVKYAQEEGYTANGFTGANVKAGTGDEFAKNPTADGKTFLGWVTEEGKTELTKTVVTAEEFNKLDAAKKFTTETPVDSHKVVYAIWSEEKLITFDANGGKFADGSTTKTDDLTDGVTAPDEPKQDGKTFLGWASKLDATETDVIDVTKLTEATTVYAVWKDGAELKVNDPAITEVVDPQHLTDEEKAAVKEAIKAANPDLTDDQIAVADDGTVTVTKDGKTATVTPDKTVKAKDEKLAAPTVKANKDGSVTITPPANEDIDSIHIEYTDENNQQGTLIVTKDPQGNWTLPQGTDPSITVDPTTGEVTIPADQVADGTVVTAFVQKGNDSSDEAIATVVKDKPQVEGAYLDVNDLFFDDMLTSGYTLPYLDVTVSFPDGTIENAISDARGYWNVPTPRNLRKGDVVYVTVYDGGKIVASQAVIVKDGYRYNDDDYYYRRHRRDEDRRRDDDIRDSEEKDEEIVVTEKHKAYMFGYQDGTVRPNASVTRAEAAAMVARLMGYNLSNYQKPGFKDTDGWYNNVINAVVSNGLMKGYSDGSFKPNKKITRAEFAELIKNIDKVNFASVPFSDVKGHWAEQAIAQAYANGRISGYNDGTFKPNAKITRAEAARILNSVFNRKVDQLGYNQAHGSIKFFTDLNANEWYYNDIIEATNNHEFVRKNDGLYEDWKNVK